MKWAIREAVDVYFKAKSTFELGARTIRAGEPVLIFDTVKTSTLEVAAQISYVTGGRGNSRLLSYEGDKTLTFQFEEALLSNEGLAILSGADLIPARNKHLAGSHPEARSVIAHYTEKYSVETSNRIDANAATNGNVFPVDASIGGIPMGGKWNVWTTEKPYVGQNASIYVMLLDDAGEMSGAPIQINLDNNIVDPAGAGITQTTAAAFATGTAAGAAAPLAVGKYYLTDTGRLKQITAVATATAAAVVVELGVDFAFNAISKWNSGDAFIAFDVNNAPIAHTAGEPGGATVVTEAAWNTNSYSAGEYDDKVAYYVDFDSVNVVWASQFNNYGDITKYKRVITATGFGNFWGDVTETTAGAGDKNYSYLLAPSGGVAQPKAYREGSTFVYKLNVPAILYQDIVLLDYYVEYQHDAAQVSILPDKFGPYMYVEGSSLVRRASDGTDLPVEFVIPKFKITTALTFTLQSTGDPSTFTFQGDAYPDFSKFDLSRKVLADIQILDADDNYDGTTGVTSDPTSYRRYKYNNDSDGEYVWKDRSLVAHQNIDYSDTASAADGLYGENNGGPVSKTPGIGNLG